MGAGTPEHLGDRTVGQWLRRSAGPGAAVSLLPGLQLLAVARRHDWGAGPVFSKGLSGSVFMLFSQR